MNFLKKLLVVILVLTLIGATYFVYFMVANEAPITQGKVIYGEAYKADLSLDIYSPTNPIYEQSPVIVFFHGGGWFAGRKESINFNRFNKAISELREKGYYIITPEYTLASKEDSPFPNCIQDAFDVLKWVESNQEIYNFDLNNVGVFGESAGAHIALMTAYSNPSSFSTTREVSLNYVVDIYGPTDLERLFQAQMIDSLKTVLKKLPSSVGDHLDVSRRIFGFDPESDPSKTQDFFAAYSPIHFMKENAPPTLLIHGDADVVVPLDQSARLVEKLDGLGIEHEIHILQNVNHAFIGAMEHQKDSIQSWISEFVLGHYK